MYLSSNVLVADVPSIGTYRFHLSRAIHKPLHGRLYMGKVFLQVTYFYLMGICMHTGGSIGSLRNSFTARRILSPET